MTKLLNDRFQAILPNVSLPSSGAILANKSPTYSKSLSDNLHLHMIKQ